jgi:hypothetical protein
VATETDLPDLDSLPSLQDRLRASLARLRARLRVQLTLEFATVAAIVLSATAAML